MLRIATLAIMIAFIPHLLAPAGPLAPREGFWEGGESPRAHADAIGGGDPYRPEQWGLGSIDAPAAWTIEAGSPRVIVAVIDSGIDLQHADLAEVPILLGHDYVDHDEMPTDAFGHGTHVAGIIAATRGNDLGISGMANVTLLVIRVLDARGQGTCMNVALAVAEAAARGSRLINLSLSCEADYAPLRVAIESASAAGVLIVAAAGTAGPVCPSFPAAYPSVLSVGAINESGALAPFSCTGAELVAPGVSILSTWADGSYKALSGTSMAAPFVSGTAALLACHSQGLSSAQLRARLSSTANDLGDPGDDDQFGHGEVNASAALQP